MVLTAPYFSRHWYDQDVNSYLIQYHRLDRFLTSFPNKHLDEFRLFSQLAFGLVTLQKSLMWLKYLHNTGVPLIEDIISLSVQEIRLREQLRTAQLRLEIGKEVCLTLYNISLLIN